MGATPDLVSFNMPLAPISVDLFVISMGCTGAPCLDFPGSLVQLHALGTCGKPRAGSMTPLWQALGLTSSGLS